MQCASQLRTKSIFRIELTLESTLVSELSEDALKSEKEQIIYGQTVHTNVKHELCKQNIDGIPDSFSRERT